MARVDGKRVREAAFEAHWKPDAWDASVFARAGGTTRKGAAYLVEGGAFAKRDESGTDAGAFVRGAVRW